MSKILIVSHGITGSTGFSNQAYLMSRALTDGGHEVFAVHRDYRGEPLSCPEGMKLPSGKDLSGINILPWGNAPWGEDIIPFYMDKYKCDYVLTLGDIWCYQFIKEIPRTRPWKWIAHYVFDTENMVTFWNESIANADLVVVPSKNSYNMLRKIGHRNVAYVPHGIDTKIFRPCCAEEKLQFRRQLGLPDGAFVIGCVAHNQTRKKLDHLLSAFSIFSAQHKDVLLLMHCAPKEQIGWDLPQIAKNLGIQNKVLFTNQAMKNVGDIHVTWEDMRRLYCSMDVHALSTGGEGFGVPIVESMACGVTNVATAYTSIPEFLCSEKGENVRGIAVPYSGLEAHHTGGYWANINVQAMAQAFEQLYNSPEMRTKYGDAAVEFAQEHYDIDLVAEEWRKFFASIEEMAKVPEEAPGLRAVMVNG